VRKNRVAALLGAAVLGGSLAGAVGALAVVLLAVVAFWRLDARELELQSVDIELGGACLDEARENIERLTEKLDAQVAEAWEEAAREHEVVEAVRAELQATVESQETWRLRALKAERQLAEAKERRDHWKAMYDDFGGCRGDMMVAMTRAERAEAALKKAIRERDKVRDVVERVRTDIARELSRICFHFREEIREHGEYEISASKERIKAHHKGQVAAYQHAVRHFDELAAMIVDAFAILDGKGDKK
jgi:hypothetical protein